METVSARMPPPKPSVPENISDSETVLQLKSYRKVCKALKQVSEGKWLPLQSSVSSTVNWEIHYVFFSATQDCFQAQMKSFPQMVEVLSWVSLSYRRPTPRPMAQNHIIDRTSSRSTIVDVRLHYLMFERWGFSLEWRPWITVKSQWSRYCGFKIYHSTEGAKLNVPLHQLQNKDCVNKNSRGVLTLLLS